jgi:hypothetical protein
MDERGEPVTLQTRANSRATLGMFGAGFIEMLARQMTADLQAIRDDTRPGQSNRLVSKGISFGAISRHLDGSWDVSNVERLPAPSLATTGSADPPTSSSAPFIKPERWSRSVCSPITPSIITTASNPVRGWEKLPILT